MKYDYLIDNAEKEWTTEGPNSEGIGGYFLYQGNLYRYRGDWGMPEPWVDVAVSVDVFLSRNGESADPRIQEIVMYLRAR